MVLADSHTISKSIDNDEKVDDNIFESIRDVDRPIIPKTRKDRQHKYKVYYSKDDDLSQGVKETKPYSEVDKITEKITVQQNHKPTEHAKHHKSPKRRVGSFWKKLRGKEKKKQTNKYDSKDRKRRISNHKKESHKIDYFTTKLSPGLTKAKKKHRKHLLLGQPEHKAAKRDASGLFSTRPYSNTPQSYKLQMGIAPQVDNMLKSKSKIKPVRPHAVAVTAPEPTEVTDNLEVQLNNIDYEISKLKEIYGVIGTKVVSPHADNAEPNILSVATPEGSIGTESNYQGTEHIEDMLSAMKAKAVSMMYAQTPPGTELESGSATETTPDSNQLATNSVLSTEAPDNEIENDGKSTVARSNLYELNPKESIDANTESHYLVARSIKEDAMTIAMNVEDLLQKELKNLYNKVKHKVSNDFRKEVHTVKSTVKGNFDKITSKICNKGKSCNITSSSSPPTTNPTTHRTCPCKPLPPKLKEKPAAIPSSIPTHMSTTKSTTAPRVKKKDEKEEDRVEDNYTPETYARQTYDDYVMLTLYEQMLAKTHDDNVRKLLATPDFPIYAKKKREARRLSKRNPETLTDVKLTEVVRNIYDDGGNMPDYDYIDPAANVSSTGATSASSNSYNDEYGLDDSSGSSDYNAQGSKPVDNKPRAQAKELKADGNDTNSGAGSYNAPLTTSIPASETSYEGLSNKISYNQYVDGYKHYLKFQQDLKNQNFSNLIKYQAHRHHSVDDIGKYILNKIPPVPTLNRRKRDLRFSDDSDNNIDYQEITTKSDDSWFRKHFYLFIDNGPPKKYHTSETVELKPGAVDLKLYITDTTPTTKHKEQILIKIDSNNAPRKAKDAQEISLDDLSKILDSIKDKGTYNPLTKGKPITQKKEDEDTFMSMDTFNATDGASMYGSGFISKLLGGERRHAYKKTPITKEYFPRTNYMYIYNPLSRFKRSVTKESFENTLMADFANKDIIEEKAATTATKEVYAEAAQTNNRETNKYGYVDIDLIPRQTPAVKLHDNTKKSRLKNFFKKFHFKKDKTKKPKPKRAVYYNYYSPNPRKERFNPIKKLKDMFKNKETGKDKEEAAPAPFHATDYDAVNAHLSAGAFKPKLEKPIMSVAEMQKQIPNISDIYFEPPEMKHTTKVKTANYYKLDQKDEDLLYNYNPSRTSTKMFIPTPIKNDKLLSAMITTESSTKAKPSTVTQTSTSVLISTITKQLPEMLRVPPSNVMTVNLKTIDLATSPITTEATSPFAIDDMRLVLDRMQKELKKSSDEYPIVTTLYDSGYEMQTEKYEYKKNVPIPMRLREDLSIRSKLTRIAKFPIRERRYKMRGSDDSEPDNDRDNLGFDGPSVLQYIHDLGNRNVNDDGKRKTAANTLKKVHPNSSMTKGKNKSVYTDYFNDLLMWHNDILNLDRVPNPSWMNILNTLQPDTENSYTTPDMKNLMVDLNEMNDFLAENVNKSIVTGFPDVPMEIPAKDRIGVRAPNNQLNEDKGMIKSVAMDDNTIVTSKDVVIRGEAKYFQYNKPKTPETLGSSDFVMKLNMLNSQLADKVQIKRKGPHIETPTRADTPAEPAFIVDTTLMAYDDDVESITKELESKKSKQAQKSGKVTAKVKSDHTSFLKNNKAPVQYYTTPLPMKPQDFHKFLIENQMGVNFVTAPMIDLPTLAEKWSTKQKDNKLSKQNDNVEDTSSDAIHLNIETTASKAEAIESTTKATKSQSQKQKEQELPSKFESTLETVVKSVKSTKKSKGKPKVANNSNGSNKKSNLGADFDRYKRSSSLKASTKAVTAKNKISPTPKYYDFFRKKVKDKLFDKKPIEQVESPTTNAITVDPHNKEVEITIINFDDLDGATTPNTYESLMLPKKDEIRPFIDFSDISYTTDTTPKSKKKTTKQREDIHNELLYQDIFNERTTSTAPTREYLNTDLTKRTEYVDHIKDGQTVTTNKLRYPFEKVPPMCPNIFNKLPNQHGKHFGNMPKRVHITSHHYKYDIFYDDIKKSGKNRGFDGSQLKHVSVTPSGMKISRRRAPTSEKGTNVEAVQLIDRTHGQRYRRRVWRTTAPKNKKRKHFTFRGCKAKSTGESTEPTGSLAELKPTSSPDTSTDVSMQKLDQTFKGSAENTGTLSLIEQTEPMVDIEDVVTLLDAQDLGVTKSDIADAVTLSAIKSEFFTSITVRDNIRRASDKAKKKTSHGTWSTSVTTTTPATTAATTVATVAATKTTTMASTTTPSSSQPGSIVYNLKQLKTTASSNRSSTDKEKSPGPQRDRQRRLFKFSFLQNRLKSFMKNLTMTTKHSNVANVTSLTTVTKDNPKRTCIKFIPDKTTTSSTVATTTEEISDEREGFCVTHRCEQPKPHPRPADDQDQTLRITAQFPTCEPPFRFQEDVPTHHAEIPTHHAEVPTHHEESSYQHVEATVPHQYNLHTTVQDQCCVPRKPLPKNPGEGLYVEPETYDDQAYYEESAVQHLPTCPTTRTNDDHPPTTHCEVKREVQPNTFTAKDVAALEVIVDLMKNTLNYEDNNIAKGLHHSILQPYATKPISLNSSTNAIQVHIAIPYDFQNGRKRSPSVPGPVRVRKVFSAKMSTPVDLEYQVHSIEGTIASSSNKPERLAITNTAGLTPGMYLLVDKPRDGFALKPLLNQINFPEIKSRQLLSGSTASMTEPKPTDSRDETTSMKSMAKVTLSKDFVAAIHQQLLELYENKLRVNKDIDKNNVRVARSIWRSRKLKEKKERKKKGVEKYIVKRRIDWESVKRYFGHDRVCSCKCKCNTAMCRACAASDAVIDELIFEFDNIGRYMADHCTEIQTFFWMNPSGGQKLRDSVNKIDRSLTDYCRRVKGKCQGRLCKTFTTYIDKRNFVKTAKVKKVEGVSGLVNDLAVLADDLNMALALNICNSEKLKENGEKFIHLMNSYIDYKPFNKRANPTTTPKKIVKQVYSLDNINVNIICNPESSSTLNEQVIAARISPEVSSERINDHLLDFDLEESKPKNRLGFVSFFPRKNKKSRLLSYFDFSKKPKVNFKRQVDNQAPTPLISDGGGAFWNDYLKAGTAEPRLARGSIKDTPTITVDVIQRAGTTGNVLKVTALTDNNNLGINTVYMTVRTSPERNPRDIETTTDTLSRNINQMLQLFGSLQDVEAMTSNVTNSNLTTNLQRDSAVHKAVSQDKPKKVSLVEKVKQKVDKAFTKHKANATTKTKTKKKKKNKNQKTAIEKEMDELSTIEHTIETITKLDVTTKATSEGSSDNMIVISSKATSEVTSQTPVTNITSSTVRLTAKSITTNDAKASTTALTSCATKTDKQSESTPIISDSKTKFGFKNMINAATVMFKKGQTTQTTKSTTEISTTTELSTELTPMQTDVIELVTCSPENDYVIDENSQSTTQNPTILIINDYGQAQQVLTDELKEGYKNLLLSIIQFETKKLNEEWDRIAYGQVKHRDETDIKRSISKSPKVEVKAPILVTPRTTPTVAVSEEETYSETEHVKTTKKAPEGLLNKIANKIGIKVINKKKVVKKPGIREARKDKNRANFIKNRKIRINSYRQEAMSPLNNKEACYSRRTTQPAQICDIQATYKHIQNLQTSVPPKTFENLMKNVSCYKYRNADASFIIPYKKKAKTWDWIRHKRSLKHFHNKIKDGHDFNDDTYVVDFRDDSSETFERFVKGDNGIYKIVKRKKRKVNLGALERGLRNIPALMPAEDELYAMVGDSVVLDCGINDPVRTCDGKFYWKTDRKRMLGLNNVAVDGLTVTIQNVAPRNSGTYTCNLDHTVRKKIKLSVLTVPSFDVVFVPVYRTETNCSYEDLLAIQRLGSLMANETHCGKACSIRIDEPVCQRDRSTNNTLVRATAVISMTPRAVNCSLQCKRDIVSSLVMLCAGNAAILSSIRVEVSKEGIRETLTPWKDMGRPVVTHTLRKKDTNGHNEYHQLTSLMTPGKVDVVLICPGGYYLLAKYKLCSSCPPNTSSKAGDNTCRSCPRGTRADPGASKCHLVKTLHRRYDWWWYPPCGYVVASSGVLFGCTACVLLSVIVHVVSRDTELQEHDGDDDEQKIPKPLPIVEVAYARPLSPSRVILPRFFRPSLTSSRATDSQETKFELWKERNRPPPLPPIDFDP